MDNVAINGIITVHAGDSFTAPLFLASSCDIKNGDEIYLGIMEPHQPFKFALVRKKLAIDQCGKIIIELKPEDTEYIMPGLYYYEVKLLRKGENDSSDVITLQSKTKLYILE